MNNTNTTAAQMNETAQAKRDSLAIEMERAIEASYRLGLGGSAVKQTGWYRDRKAQLAAYDREMA